MAARSISLIEGWQVYPPLPLYSGGEGPGVRGSRLCKNLNPLTPGPSPPSTEERGARWAIHHLRINRGAVPARGAPFLGRSTA